MEFDINNFKTDKVSKDLLVVGVDFCDEDVNCLVAGRQRGDEIEILSQFNGDLAVGIYALLTGYADMRNKKDAPKKVICDGDDESDNVYCPCCHERLGSNDFVWEDFYERNWKHMYCRECGQAMIWK